MADDDILLVSEWEDLTVAELKEELTSRGLETTGRKADLVARLEASDREILNAQNPEEEEEAPNEEEENGDDIVVWTEDDPARGEEAEEDCTVLTVKDGEDQPTEEQKLKEDKTSKEEGHADAPKDNSFAVTWHGQKVIVPFKDEVQKDIKHCAKQQNIIMYPAEVSDIYADSIRPLVEKAINVSMEMDEVNPGQQIKGYLRLKFGSAALAADALKILKDYQPDDREIALEHFGENDSEGHVLSKVKSKDACCKDPLLRRLMFVSNLPDDATEEALRLLFPDALRLIIPVREDPAEKIGHVYVEYASETDATEAVAQHQDLELSERKLYVIKSMTERKESFGLLRDSLRKYWLEQIKSLEGVKAKPHNKSVRELQELETKLVQLKKRIGRDNRKLLALRMPVPENELFTIPDGDSDKEDTEGSRDKDTERSLSSSRKDARPPERRRSPPRHRYSPSRGRSSYRGYRGSTGYRGRPPGIPPRADHIVSRLHELVGALSDFGGSRGGRGGYYEGSRGGGRGGSSGYGGGSGYGRDYPESSSHYGNKRPGGYMDYDSDRKRRMSEYPGSGYSGRSNHGYGSYSSSHRGSGYNY